jgi:hypothetical protein
MLSSIKGRIERLEALLPEAPREPRVAWVVEPSLPTGFSPDDLVSYFEIDGQVVPAPPNMRLRDLPSTVRRVYGGADPTQIV